MVWEALNGPELSTRVSFISAHGHVGADAFAAAFGPTVDDTASTWRSDGTFLDLQQVPGGPEQQLGCEPYSFLPPYDPLAAANANNPDVPPPEAHPKRLVFVRRGLCSFFHKARLAAQAGADGIIIANTDESAFTPSADEQEMGMIEKKQVALVPLLMVNNSTARVVERMLAGQGQIKVKTGQDKPEKQKLVINGYVIANAIVQPPQ